jgi:hypothetical protein
MREIHGASIPHSSTVEGTFFGFFFSMEKIVEKVDFLYKESVRKCNEGWFHTTSSEAVERKITSVCTPTWEGYMFYRIT